MGSRASNLFVWFKATNTTYLPTHATNKKMLPYFTTCAATLPLTACMCPAGRCHPAPTCICKCQHKDSIFFLALVALASIQRGPNSRAKHLQGLLSSTPCRAIEESAAGQQQQHTTGISCLMITLYHRCVLATSNVMQVMP